MKQTLMKTLAVIFVMGMLAVPGNGLTADTGMKEAGGMMMQDEGTMPESMVQKNKEMMKEEMTSEMPEPMPGEMEKEMESEEMRQGSAEEMSTEVGNGAPNGKKMMN